MRNENINTLGALIFFLIYISATFVLKIEKIRMAWLNFIDLEINNDFWNPCLNSVHQRAVCSVCVFSVNDFLVNAPYQARVHSIYRSICELIVNERPTSKYNSNLSRTQNK